MLKKLLLLFICSCFLACEQKKVSYTNPKQDSINYYLEKAGEETFSYDVRAKYCDKAYSLLNLNANDSVTMNAITKILGCYSATNKVEKFNKNFLLFQEKIEKNNLKNNLADLYYYKGNYYKQKQILDSALLYFKKAEKIFIKRDNKLKIAVSQLNIAQIQYYFNDYLNSKLYINKALTYLKRSKYYRRLYICYTIKGNTLVELKEFKEAVNSFKEAITIYKKYNVNIEGESSIGTCFNNIGNAYRQQQNFKIAMFYFNKALEEKEIEKDLELKGYLLNNISYCRIKAGIDLELVENDLKDASKIFKKFNNNLEYAMSFTYLSNYFQKIKNIEKAIFFAKKGVSVIDKYKNPGNYLLVLSELIKVDTLNASKYFKEYEEVSEKYLLDERKKRDQYYTILLETDEIKQEKDVAIKQKWFVTITALGILLSTILLFIIYRQRSKQKELVLVQNQQKANEEIYQLMISQLDATEKAKEIEKKRIARELHDGIMNKLASIRFNLFLLNKKRDDATIDNCLHQAENLHAVEQEIRNIAHDLNKEVFYHQQFLPLIETHIKEQLANTSIHYTIDNDETIDWNTIIGHIKMNIYRIVQESIHNCIKHANATQITLSFIKDSNNLCFMIKDNGVGIASENETHSTDAYSTTTGKGIGLQNIKERVNDLHGNFSIHSIAGTTTISVSIPL